MYAWYLACTREIEGSWESNNCRGCAALVPLAIMVSITTVSRLGTCLALRMYFRIMTTHQTLETLRRRCGVTALVTTKTWWATTEKLVSVTSDAAVGECTGLVCLVDRLPNLLTGQLRGCLIVVMWVTAKRKERRKAKEKTRQEPRKEGKHLGQRIIRNVTMSRLMKLERDFLHDPLYPRTCPHGVLPKLS